MGQTKESCRVGMVVVPWGVGYRQAEGRAVAGQEYKPAGGIPGRQGTRVAGRARAR